MHLACRPVVRALTALALVAAPAAAQSGSSAVGFQAGYSSAQLIAQDLDVNLQSRQGAYVGVYYRARVLSWLTVQPELDFTVKGGEVPLGSLSQFFEQLSLDLGVLEIPVLARISTPYRGQRLRPFVFGGASLGLEVGCSRTFVSQDRVNSVECSDSSSITVGTETITVGPIEVPSPDVSWIVGAGIQWERRDISIGLEARYQRGTRQVLNIDTPVHNQLWAILVALTI
jgi:hypothetical protein